ncbi:hypothetical protein [Paenibacillus donghaensis]|uniref:Uncharacterized protein n=1 Tax=Paenibacillus donghaensis TaxID=414771 RepID=A0A2Z2KQB8_9BACL|nr:hypothetical protein [Paenibacillus donghaensis]ASA24909.1 hypothetical protein B9T62_31645 [Paenibacillus donghaensis]
MNKKDTEVMVRLAKEGKRISKIWTEDFPEYDYWDIYFEVYGAGERSSVGVKRMITARLDKLTEADDKQDRINIIEELNELVVHLYSRYKSSQQKLNEIRTIINQ